MEYAWKELTWPAGRHGRCGGEYGVMGGGWAWACWCLVLCWGALLSRSLDALRHIYVQNAFKPYHIYMSYKTIIP